MDMASDYESGDSGFESRQGSFANMCFNTCHKSIAQEKSSRQLDSPNQKTAKYNVEEEFPVA